MTTTDTLFGIMASLNLVGPDYSTLFQLTRPFGLSETALRSALSRMSAKGIIEVVREGKKARYSLTGKGRRIGKNVSAAFSTPAKEGEWKGEFWLAAFSVPEAEAEQRYRIRKKLAAYRYGSWLSGLWIRPVLPSEPQYNGLKALEEDGHCRLMRGGLRTSVSLEESGRIWRLEEKAEQMEKAVALLEKNLETAGRLSGTEAFRLRYEIGNEVVGTLAEDPLLPPELLPENWPGKDLRKLFEEWDRVAEERSRLFFTSIIQIGEKSDKNT